MASDPIEASIETLIDEYGLNKVVNAIIAICYGKAEHLRTNWQDERAAKVWQAQGNKLSRVALMPRC